MSSSSGLGKEKAKGSMARIDDTPTTGQRLRKGCDSASQIIYNFGGLIAFELVIMTLTTRWWAGSSSMIVTYPIVSCTYLSLCGAVGIALLLVGSPEGYET